MNDYKELIDILNDIDFADCSEHCFFPCGGSGNCFVLKTADAIERLVWERDAAIADISYLIIRPLEVCKLCTHEFVDTDAEKCPNCSDITAYGNFEWRGVTDEIN